MTRPNGNITRKRDDAVMCSWYIPFLLLLGLVWPATAGADERTADDRLFVHLSDGQVNVYPMAFVEEVATTPSGELQLTLKGGEELTIEALEPTRIDVYSVVGTRVATIEAREGTTHVALPGGFYLVGDQKVFIDNH